MSASQTAEWRFSRPKRLVGEPEQVANWNSRLLALKGAIFHAWEDFFLLVGAAAGGLIGLLFVVSTLTAGAQSGRAQRGAKLFMTPCVFHFAVIMSISAAAMAPIATSQAVGAVLTTAAFVGLIYMAHIMSSLRKEEATEHWTDFGIMARRHSHVTWA